MPKRVYTFECESSCLLNPEGKFYRLIVRAEDPESIVVSLVGSNLSSLLINLERLPLKDRNTIQEKVDEHFFMEDAAEEFLAHSLIDPMDEILERSKLVDELNKRNGWGRK